MASSGCGADACSRFRVILSRRNRKDLGPGILGAMETNGADLLPAIDG